MPLKVLDATGSLVSSDTMADADGTLIGVHTSETKKATFRFAGNFTPVAAPTDSILIQGSNSMTGRIKRIALGGVATTAGSMQVQLIRRSTAPTLGSAVLNAVTAGKHDKTDAAATCLFFTVGTANITTPGASAGQEGEGRLYLPLSTNPPAPMVWDFARNQDKALILRGGTDYLAINFNGSALPAGGSIDFEVEMEEDAS